MPINYRQATDKDVEKIKILASDNGKTIQILSQKQNEAAKNKDFETAKEYSSLVKYYKTYEKALSYVRLVLISGKGKVAPPNDELIPHIRLIDHQIFD